MCSGTISTPRLVAASRTSACLQNSCSNRDLPAPGVVNSDTKGCRVSTFVGKPMPSPFRYELKAGESKIIFTVLSRSNKVGKQRSSASRSISYRDKVQLSNTVCSRRTYSCDRSFSLINAECTLVVIECWQDNRPCIKISKARRTCNGEIPEGAASACPKKTHTG